MAENVRIDPAAHAKLAELARLTNTTMTDVLAKAIANYEREVFIAGVVADFAALSSDEWAEEAADATQWETTSADGLPEE